MPNKKRNYPSALLPPSPCRGKGCWWSCLPPHSLHSSRPQYKVLWLESIWYKIRLFSKECSAPNVKICWDIGMLWEQLRSSVQQNTQTNSWCQWRRLSANCFGLQFCPRSDKSCKPAWWSCLWHNLYSHRDIPLFYVYPYPYPIPLPIPLPGHTVILCIEKDWI